VLGSYRSNFFFIEKEPHSQPEISEGNIEEEKWKGELKAEGR
jgi:hypothetical protein